MCETKSLDVASTLNDSLAYKKRQLETKLAETNAAIAALQEHPEVADVLTKVGKALGRSY